MRSTALHQASFLAAQVLDEMKDVKTSVQESLLLLAEDNKHNGTHLDNMANFVGNSTNSNVDILKLLRKFQEEVNNLKTNPGAWKTFTKTQRVRKTHTSTVGLRIVFALW